MNEEVEKVYAVSDSHWGLKIQSAVVEKRTKNQVKIDKNAGSAFGYRRNIPPNDLCLAPTRAEACRRAIVRHKLSLANLVERVKETGDSIKKLEAMLEAEVAKDQTA